MQPARTPESVVIVGAGLGGMRTAEALRREGYRGRISLIGAEAHAPYDRPPLSKQILAGKWLDQCATLRVPEEWGELDVDLRLGCAVTSADDKAVYLSDGDTLSYGALVVATGVRPRPLPAQPDHPNLHLLRTLDDCRALRESLRQARSLLIVGGGFIGGEVASTALGNGVDVMVVEEASVPFARVLGEEVGALCAQLHRDHGVKLLCGVRVERFVDEGDGITVRLDDGGTAGADCALVSIGTVVDDSWLSGLGVTAGRGLTCDEHGLVLGTANVYAVGDIAAWKDSTDGGYRRIEHWTSATEQAAVVAQRLAGREISKFADVPPYFWSDQHGIKLQMVGRPELATSVELLHAPGTLKGTVVGYFTGPSLAAVATFHAPRLLAKYRSLVVEGAHRREVRAKATQLA